MNTRLRLGRTGWSPWTVRRSLLFLTLVAVLSAAGGFAPRATAARSMIDLGSLGTGCGSSGAAINNLSQVAGSSCGRAFRWTRATGMQDLGTLNTPGEPDLGGTHAEAINAFGQVTGVSWSWQSHLFQGFVWTPSSGMQSLGDGDAPAINGRGQVAGTSTGNMSVYRPYAFIWSPSTGTQTLRPTADIAFRDFAYAINNLGDVTGLLQTRPAPTYAIVSHAFLWTPSGGMQDLGTLTDESVSDGFAINNLDEVAGTAGTNVDIAQPGASSTVSDATHAFLWTRWGGMRDLGIVRGGTWSSAVAINDLGEVAGTADAADGNDHAFLWTPWSGMRDLGPGDATAMNKLGQVAVSWQGGAYRWTPLTGMQYLGPGSAAAINDWGQVTGQNGNGDAFLWTP
jgi:probable HAF family extracellular repeat protein